MAENYLNVNNWTLNPGKELVVRGLVKPNAVRFSINLGHSYEEIALHLDVRFNYGPDVRTIVMNTRESGTWTEEQRDKNFPFEAGQEFEVCIVFNFDTFDIYLSNGQKVVFPNRKGDLKYQYIFFVDDAEIREIIVRPSSKPTKR